ncbi:MAG: FimB/Mfa2 family fimbrial subunit [Tannerellaceae bacterium]|nr:FimB/Mfa2 family fimbrial subunit [Tannerellaceae bacterium]
MKRLILLFCFLPLFLGSCTLEEQLLAEVSPPVGEEVRVRFSLRTPQGMTTLTRTPLEESDENQILTVRVLLFKEESPGVMTYCFGATKTGSLTIANGQTTFDVDLPAGTYDVMLLANAQSIVEGASIVLGQTKNDIIQRLVRESHVLWSDQAIPLWGSLPGLEIKAGEIPASQTVEMIRMMAKIDIDMEESLKAYFSIEHIRLYNFSSRGSLVPDAGVLSGNRVTAPTRPAGSEGFRPMTTPLEYNASEGLTPEGCKRLIYVYEAPAGSDATLGDNPCLIVGGRYKGGDLGYYRIDFVGSSNGQKVYLPLLRNHTYTLHITGVSSRGYDKEEEALASPPLNLETTLLAWTDNEVKHVVFDEHYMLGTSAERLDLTADALPYNTAWNKLRVVASRPSGYSMEVVGPDGTPATAQWLSVNIPNAQNKEEIFVRAEENATGAERVAYLRFRSGKLERTVTVVQSAARGFRLTILDKARLTEISQADFTGNANQKQTVQVLWQPASATLRVEVSHIAAAFSGQGLPADQTVFQANGFTEFTLVTKQATQGMLTRVDFILSDATGRSAVKTLFVRQTP